VVGYALGSRPSSIKNYRDEFDPIFPTPERAGTSGRSTSPARRCSTKYGKLDFASFSGLIKSFVGYDENIWSGIQTKDDGEERTSGFAKRLITGLAAERYFESVHSTLPSSKGFQWRI